jgi:hypothetical protein
VVLCAAAHANLLSLNWPTFQQGVANIVWLLHMEQDTPRVDVRDATGCRGLHSKAGWKAQQAMAVIAHPQ